VKHRVKNAVNYVSQFEQAVGRYAEMHDADGIVCGHIHTPVIRQIRGISYYNCGDWVENSTALVEHLDGRIHLVHWRETGSANDAKSIPVASGMSDQSDLLVSELESTA
jgi:UDP-2,3-diacylglucosamine pyrophosphatase LpxH